MLKTYGSFHTTRSALAADIKSLMNEYTDRTASDNEMLDVVSKWVENCGGLLLADPDQSKTELHKSIIRLIGARRAAVIKTCLVQLEKAR